MCNAANKLILGLSLCLALFACGPDPDREAADRLVAQAQGAMDRQNFDSAFIFLDSLSATYPKQIEAGRRGLALRPRAIVGKTETDIIRTQLQLQDAQARLDSLRPLFQTIDRSEEVLEPYFIHQDFKRNLQTANTVEARVNPSGEFILISGLEGRSTAHTVISITAGARTARSGSVSFDSSLPLSRESQRFSEHKADTIGRLATEIDGLPATLTFIGPKKSPTALLSESHVHAIADSWRLAQTMTEIRLLASNLQKLNAKLQLARDQVARTDNNNNNNPSESE